MDTIRSCFFVYSHNPSDINEHLLTLKNLAAECCSIAEMGVRDIVSTWAFLYGLASNKKEQKRLLSLDITDIPLINDVIDVAKDANISMDFVKADSTKYEVDSNFDLLFIDTFHVYGQLKRELELHHSKVNKYIVMHDTYVDGTYGEVLRLKLDQDKIKAETGFSDEDINKGLVYAILEFLKDHQEWIVKHEFLNNSGLVVLERVGHEKSKIL